MYYKKVEKYLNEATSQTDAIRTLQRWKQAKLNGLDFYLAWDSELPTDQQPNVWTSKPVKL